MEQNKTLGLKIDEMPMEILYKMTRSCTRVVYCTRKCTSIDDVATFSIRTRYFSILFSVYSSISFFFFFLNPKSSVRLKIISKKCVDSKLYYLCDFFMKCLYSIVMLASAIRLFHSTGVFDMGKYVFENN